MATQSLKFHRLVGPLSSLTNQSFAKGEVYFIKDSSTATTGKLYICSTAGTGSAATLEDYSVDTNTWPADNLLNTISKNGNVLTITPRNGTAFTFTNTTYQRQPDSKIVSDGTDVSLAYTGDMYKWNYAYDTLVDIEELLAAI